MQEPAQMEASKNGSAAIAGGPLAGLRILDFATLIAGPLASTLLADLGAEVVKVELPDGRDGLRQLPPHKNGAPLWWKVGNRNKQGITLDVRKPEGRELFLRLLPSFHVLVENFRSGTMDSWGLDSGTLFGVNAKLTVLRVTGFGQTGPYRTRAGFARVFDAMSGFTYLNGERGGPPMNLGYPLSDAISGLFGAISILSAAYERARNPEAPGQEVDLAATEAMFRVLDFLAVEYDQMGVVRDRLGNQSSYSAPSNIYGTRDGKWLSMAISVQTIFERFCTGIGQPQLARDPRFANNTSRVANRDALDAVIHAWAASRDLADLAAILTQHEISFSPVYSIKEVFEDAHFQAREMIISVADRTLGSLRMQNVVPRFSRTPGSVRTTGPDLGEHNEQVYAALGIDALALRELRAKGVV